MAAAGLCMWMLGPAQTTIADPRPSAAPSTSGSSSDRSMCGKLSLAFASERSAERRVLSRGIFLTMSPASAFTLVALPHERVLLHDEAEAAAELRQRALLELRREILALLALERLVLALAELIV